MFTQSQQLHTAFRADLMVLPLVPFTRCLHCSALILLWYLPVWYPSIWFYIGFSLCSCVLDGGGGGVALIRAVHSCHNSQSGFFNLITRLVACFTGIGAEATKARPKWVPQVVLPVLEMRL